ncbi:hypothetical protein ACHAW6_006678 [Cyclotella cf. meneghiniana]
MVPRNNFQPSLLNITGQSLSLAENLLFVRKIKVKTLKAFEGMLWGQKLVGYTDHKNLMHATLGLICDQV